MNNAIFFDPSVFQLRPITVEHKSADGQQWTYTLPDIAEQALIDPQGCDAWRCLSMSRRARSSACRVVCVASPVLAFVVGIHHGFDHDSNTQRVPSFYSLISKNFIKPGTMMATNCTHILDTYGIFSRETT